MINPKKEITKKLVTFKSNMKPRIGLKILNWVKTKGTSGSVGHANKLKKNPENTVKYVNVFIELTFSTCWVFLKKSEEQRKGKAKRIEVYLIETDKPTHAERIISFCKEYLFPMSCPRAIIIIANPNRMLFGERWSTIKNPEGKINKIVNKNKLIVKDCLRINLEPI